MGLRKAILFFCFSIVALGQDGTISISGAAPQVSFPFDNRNTGCSTLELTYTVVGGSAVSVQLENAFDSGGTPGVFTTTGWTIGTGTNPMTNTNSGQLIVTGFFPWFRINWTSFTGTSYLARLKCYKANVFHNGITTSTTISGNVKIATVDTAGTPPASIFQIGGFDGANVQNLQVDSSKELVVTLAPATGTDALGNGQLMGWRNAAIGSLAAQVAPYYYDGQSNNWERQLYCGANTPTTINPSTATTTLLLAAVGGQKNRICALEIASTGTQTVKLVAGTQTTTPCDTGQVTLSSTYQLVVNQDIFLGGNVGSYVQGTVANQQICVVTSAAVSVFVTAHSATY